MTPREEDAVPVDLCRRLRESPTIAQRLLAVIWIGSRSSATDLHDESDFDIQIVLDRPDLVASLALANILAGYTNVDLSIMYRHDIYGREGTVDFQDGTKGPFFMYVLASGTLLYGEEVYRDAVHGLRLPELTPSLLFTIREYLSRLRSMMLQGEPAPFHFKKYSLKLLKDFLVLAGHLDPHRMARVSNRDVLDDIRRLHSFGAEADAALPAITDFSRPFTLQEKAIILFELEQLVARIRS